MKIIIISTVFWFECGTETQLKSDKRNVSDQNPSPAAMIQYKCHLHNIMHQVINLNCIIAAGEGLRSEILCIYQIQLCFNTKKL